MDFSFNQDQILIAESAATFLGDQSSSEAVRRAMASEIGYEEDVWRQLTQEMGWQLTHIPEHFDGLGLGYVELCILFEAMGQHLFCAPFFSTVGLGVSAIRLCGSVEQQQTMLAEIAAGQQQYSLAFSSSNRQWGVDSIGLEYSKIDSEITINGSAHYVIDGHSADKLIVVARNSKDQKISFFALDALTQGVSITATPSMDQTRKLARVDFEQVKVQQNAMLGVVGSAGNGDDSSSEDDESKFLDLYALACIAQAAEQLGVADRSLSLTVDYIKERKQFGRVVGSFQAMKHKAADMMNRVEASRSAVYYAACVADDYFAAQGSNTSSADQASVELRQAASIANAYCCDAAFTNAGTAMQMHGGVGFTWEYDVHLYFKRAKAAQNSFGDSAWHKQSLANMLLGDSL